MADAIHPPLPTSEDAFAQDERISFSRLDNKYIAVNDEDGTELEFNAATRQWVLPADDDDQEHHRQSAHLAELAQSGSTTTAQDVSASRKRKDGPLNGTEQTPDDSASGDAAPIKKLRPAKKQKAPPPPRQNTAVYVTGLPADATADEVHDLFSRKAGVVAEEIDSGRPRIKMYTDEAGAFKGDALVVFFKPQSVEMAIMLLDDTDLRIEPSGRGSGRMRVQAADASYKKTKYDENGDGGDKATPDAAAQAQQQQQHRPPQQQQSRADRDRDRQKIIKRTQKLDAKLADWSDDEDSAAAAAARTRGDTAAAATSSKWDRLVVLRHMFTLAELEEDPAALLEIKEDVRDECAKLGAVTNVVLFDEEPDGVVSVKFAEPQAAQACITMMHGRSFDGRVVEATLATGREKFRKSKKGQGDDGDD